MVLNDFNFRVLTMLKKVAILVDGDFFIRRHKAYFKRLNFYTKIDFKCLWNSL